MMVRAIVGKSSLELVKSGRLAVGRSEAWRLASGWGGLCRTGALVLPNGNFTAVS